MPECRRPMNNSLTPIDDAGYQPNGLEADFIGREEAFVFGVNLGVSS